jgi:TPR repeat protein
MLLFSDVCKPTKGLAFASAHAGSELHTGTPVPGLPKAGRYLVGVAVLALTLAALATHHPADSSVITQLYQQATDGQSRKAQVELGIAYRDGLYGLTRDQHTAALWLEKAAGAGDAYAAALLGDVYARGKGVQQDDATAMRWWRQAAQAGNAHATAKIGLALMQHASTPYARDEAQQWLQRAASQGYAEARQAVGVDSAQAMTVFAPGAQGADKLLSSLYQQWKRIVPGSQDIADLKQAAFGGDNVAQYQLALRYRDGSWGVKADPQQALSWLQQAAQHGNPVAMDTLANAYRQGSWGLALNPALASQWTERAAHVRAYDSQENLG